MKISIGKYLLCGSDMELTLHILNKEQQLSWNNKNEESGRQQYASLIKSDDDTKVNLITVLVTRNS
jgi:hypothetical protein